MDTSKVLIRKVLGEKGAAEFENKLKMFSQSDADMKFRRTAYARTIDNTMEITNAVMNRGRKTYAGASVSAANLAGTSIYAGIMRSFVQSVAPIFAVQRNIDAPEQKIMYVDFYDVMNNNLIVPNIGADKAWADAKNRISAVLNIVSDKTWTSAAGDPIVPKTFRAEVYNDATLVGVIMDAGNGKLFCTDGILTSSSSDNVITYNNNGASTIKLTFATGVTANKIVYSVIFDTTSKDEVNKAYGQVKYYDMAVSPILVPVERNVIADHAMAKQGIINNDELYANFTENEYTKVVNQRVFDAILGGYAGDTYKLDLSAFSIASGYYETIVRSFKSLLTQAENQLAAQTYKGAKCTGYLASPEAVNMFDLMVAGDGWVKNMNSTYYKDIVGWYNDVPVVRCTDLGAGELMLTHRTEDGYLAPLFHGMFLAPTELPVVANYQNMTKYASGMYSMEGMGFSSSALCVKLKVVAPAGLTLAKL